jgi:hypothetical protein
MLKTMRRNPVIWSGARETKLPKQSHSISRPMADVLEARSAEFLKQAVEHIPDLSAWSKLYAATQTLLSAVREERVPAALIEICSNLLACEQLAVVEIERQARVVRLLAEESLSLERRGILIQSARFLEPWIVPGTAWIPSDFGQGDDALVPLGISAVVPLWKDEWSSGAMVLFQLLPQRNGFDAEDRQILRLLSFYAGPCWRSQAHG